MKTRTYTLQKRFTCPIGHRLSKNLDLCKNIHGHAFTFIVSIKSNYLNNEDMVMDFTDLKKIVNKHINKLDHGLMLNRNDPFFKELSLCSEKVTIFDGDPTAESLAEYLYKEIEKDLEVEPFIKMDFVRVFENENSSITYSEE